jgi:hypothetical protein
LDPDAVTVQSAHKNALERILRNGLAMDAEEQKRVEWLMANESIGRWFKSTRPRKLLVNGFGSLDRITPMSFFCAMLIQSLSSIGSVILLSHFCGLEMPEVGTSGPKDRRTSGLLKSLLIQLVAQWETSNITCFDHDFLDTLKATSPGWGLPQQMQLLRHLIATLPSTTPIFIFIDGTNYYETVQLRDETKQVIKEINNLLFQEGVQVVVKVLITYPTRSYHLYEEFRRKEVVNMPEDMDGFSTRFSDSNLRVQLHSTTAARLDRSRSRSRHK